MNTLSLISAIMGLSLMAPLCFQIHRGTVKQNAATWILWSIMDAIAAVSIIVQGGNYILPLFYAIGASITTFFILRSKSFSWTKLETVIAVCVIVSLFFWSVSGPKTATILISCSMFLAGVPQLRDSFVNPYDTPVLLYSGFTVANLLSVIAGKSWCIEERFYPTVGVVFCILVVLFGCKKFFQPQINTSS